MTKHEKAMHEKLVLQNVALEKEVERLENSNLSSIKQYREELGKTKALSDVILVLTRGLSNKECHYD